MGILAVENKEQVHPLDGINIHPLIQNEIEKREAPIAFKFQKQQVIMDDQFKLYSSVDGENFTLFDLLSNLVESADISASDPQIIARLSKELKEWLISCEESNMGADYN